jgi:hypothetical protein
MKPMYKKRPECIPKKKKKRTKNTKEVETTKKQATSQKK